MYKTFRIPAVANLVASLCLSATFSLARAQSPSVQILVGIVRTTNGAPVSGARVDFIQNGTTKPQETVTDETGKFALTYSAAESYVLRVRKEGYRESQERLMLPLAGDTPVTISLTREGAGDGGMRQDGMQFSDKPDFTVAGITDWTAAGGHGSDVNLRASEALAADTRGLGAPTVQDELSNSKLESALRAAVQKDPTSFQANRALGAFCMRERHFGDAVPVLEKAHQLNAADYEVSYDLARSYEGRGQYEQAKALVLQLLSTTDRAELHRLLADMEEREKRPLAAEREYERAVRLEPSEENYFAWGGELLAHRAVEAAVEVFTKGAQAFPKSERMRAALGAALYAHGSYEEGALRVCEASDLNPSDPEPYLFLGKMEEASPRALPCAQEKLGRFAHEQPNDPWANYYYGIALQKAKDAQDHIRQSETLLQQAVRLKASFAQAYVQLGVLQSQRGEWESAKTCFEKAVASDGSLPDPHFRLAQVYSRAGDRQRAAQELQTFEKLKQSDAAAVEQRRREIQQFVVVLKKPSDSSTQ
jgi:tetratricopeptide (TPR) repeat protein